MKIEFARPNLSATLLTVALVMTYQLGLAAEAYIIVDQGSGFILDSRAANKRHSPASLAKIASAMVTLDWIEASRKRSSEMIEISPVALSHGGANPVGLQIGDRASLRDLLYCALMASDNTAIMAIAEFVGADLLRASAPGDNPIGAFVYQMNQLAAKLSMRQTKFTNPTGLDHVSPRPVTTAADLARLARYATTDSGFRFYVSQKTRNIQVLRGGVNLQLTLQNTNQLLGQGEIDGVKTGRTARAGDCLILSAARAPESRTEGNTVYINPRRLIVVLLGSQDRFGEGSALMARAWILYEQWRAGGRITNAEQMLR